MRKLGRGQLNLQSSDSRRHTLTLRMAEKPISKHVNLMKHAKKLIGLVAAGISAFSAPRFASASQYEATDPVITLPSQEQYARHAAIKNDKDYENPVVKIVKDKRLWAGVGVAAVGAGGYYAYQTAEKKKAEQVRIDEDLSSFHSSSHASLHPWSSVGTAQHSNM